MQTIWIKKALKTKQTKKTNTTHRLENKAIIVLDVADPQRYSQAILSGQKTTPRP